MRAIQPLLVVLLTAFSAQSVSASTSYTVREGDSLGSIAEKQLHAFSRCQEVYALNKTRINNINFLKPGTQLVLPDVATASKTVKVVKAPQRAAVSHEAKAPQEAAATHETKASQEAVVGPEAKAPQEAAASHEAKAPQEAAAPHETKAIKSTRTIKTIKANKTKASKTSDASSPVRGKGFYYTVASGDMVSGILCRFHLDQDEFVRLNRIEDLDSLSIGQKLYIPATFEHERPRGEFKQAHRGLLGDIGRVLARSLRWPIAGAISSGFGFRGNHFHAGVDIPNKTGSPIFAAEGGKVVRSSRFGEYGEVVDVAHKDGLVTRYAHCSKLLVAVGEQVSQGETIALVGSTGRASTAHLHFEIRLKDRPIDPEKFK